ncbi:hypothetical protein N7510_005593 [Penicillium lagena]|uniref:uncharacterized protein n=1 Tax=Penicillium lagena TaxID=94218 RepID=UPI00253F6BC9|nr:uncharacterized protein N7510_005593 [Penicillium lagena]KAJ5612399.1 hypothetical protein N7510_005593 [Penicillium lagena]
MSKSHADERSRILLTDDPATIHKKVKVALTDSEATITYDPVQRPGVSNLIEILSHFEERPCETIVREYKSASLRALKEQVAGQITHHLRHIREGYAALVANPASVDTIAQMGAQAAQDHTEETMRSVRAAVGL